MDKVIESMPRLEITGTRQQLIVNEKPVILLGGELCNSSSSSLDYLRPVWDRLVALNCNFVIASVSWELVEPVEGLFDFSLVDGIIGEARKHGLRLVLIWFGTWKNAESAYAPAWVKTDTGCFKRMRRRDGTPGRTISCFSGEACQADARAFAAFMEHLRQVDGENHTVVMVQVENETGFLGSDRDYSQEADQAFEEKVPEQLLGYLDEHYETLLPEVRKPWDESKHARSTWRETFGGCAEEIFMAYHIASYVEKVARAGKEKFPLPMYANAWIVQFDGEKAGEYPSGGPVSRMHDIWRCAAPSIDLLAPDIYLFEFPGVCESYTRSNNPLFIPESRRDRWAAANVLYAVGKCHALGFAPFGIDKVGFEPVPGAGKTFGDELSDMRMEDCAWVGRELSKTYRLLGDMLPVISGFFGTPDMTGILQGASMVQAVELGGYRLKITFLSPLARAVIPGSGMIIAEAPGKFIIAGRNFSVEFLNIETGGDCIDFLSVEEGKYLEGKWLPCRRLNGDETVSITMDDIAMVKRIELYRYR